MNYLERIKHQREKEQIKKDIDNYAEKRNSIRKSKVMHKDDMLYLVDDTLVRATKVSPARNKLEAK